MARAFACASAAEYEHHIEIKILPQRLIHLRYPLSFSKTRTNLTDDMAASR